MSREIDRIINKFEIIFKKKDKSHHNPYFDQLEKKNLNKCINTTYVSYVGNFVNKFERDISKFVRSKYAVATSSGTAALHLALRYYNIKTNHEVLVPSLTYVATVNAIRYLNSSPNFVDVDNENLGICPIKLDKYLKKTTKKINGKLFNKKTKKEIKALIAVHLYGLPCKIDQIKQICKKYKIILIEDAAESLGSFYKSKHTGTFGEIGVLSFNGNKTITCGGGGMIITNSKRIAQKLKHLSTHAKVSSRLDHYHDEVGYNYRMTNLSAALGCGQLNKIKKILQLKVKNFKWYKYNFKDFKSLEILKEPKNSISNYWLIVGKFKTIAEKNYVFKSLKNKGFGVRLCWRPLHTLRIFKKFPKDNLKNTNKIYNHTMTFPSSSKINL
tara:strand:- start:8131 stop:9285 length:1155 start_codon:yes stop_codon:yes gene_type:complete